MSILALLSVIRITRSLPLGTPHCCANRASQYSSPSCPLSSCLVLDAFLSGWYLPAWPYRIGVGSLGNHSPSLYLFPLHLLVPVRGSDYCVLNVMPVLFQLSHFVCIRSVFSDDSSLMFILLGLAVSCTIRPGV